LEDAGGLGVAFPGGGAFGVAEGAEPVQAVDKAFE